MNINLFNDKDKNVFKDKCELLMKNMKIYHYNFLDPKPEMFKSIVNIIINYIIENKKIMYGGYGLYLLLNDIDKHIIYDQYDLPDVEFYSYNPVSDVVKLCNILHEHNFKHVIGQE
jgi:hypothetical protein